MAPDFLSFFFFFFNQYVFQAKWLLSHIIIEKATIHSERGIHLVVMIIIKPNRKSLRACFKALIDLPSSIHFCSISRRKCNYEFSTVFRKSCIVFCAKMKEVNPMKFNFSITNICFDTNQICNKSIEINWIRSWIIGIHFCFTENTYTC